MNSKPQLYTAMVTSVTNVAGKFYVVKLTFSEPASPSNRGEPKEMQYLAGQYVIFKIGPPKGNHTLSIASAPNPDGTIELLQSVAPMGEGSKWMLGLKPGDPIQFLGPLGRFTFDHASTRPKVFVATGCGIAPLRAMLMEELNGQRTINNKQGTINNKQMMLFWGLRHEEDVFWKEEFEALATNHPNFRYTITLSQPTPSWNGTRGRVTEHVLKEIPDVKNAEFYLCGARAMIVDMRELLIKNGVPAEQIFTETFF